MIKKVLLTLSGIVAVIVLIFFAWHFLLSIYEVKYNHNFPQESLKTNSKYFLECTGLNSLGWEINWRDINATLKILEGNNLVKIKRLSKNKYEFLTGSEEGNFSFEISSAFSLNPSKFSFKILIE